jgi:pimeloyl-ACP methyl ester carboxylesterase
MHLCLKEHINGTGELGRLILKPGFLMGGTRYLLQTVFSNKRSDIYDHGRKSEKEKQNVVILPGFTGDVGPYEELAGNLRDSANVYAPSTLPRGIKAVLSRMSIEEQAQLLLQYLDKFKSVDGTDGEMNLVGHSNGGLIALLALRMSEKVHNNRHRIGKIITIATGLKPPVKGGLGYIPGVSSYYGAVRDLRGESPLFSAISPYYDRVTLSLVSMWDQLFSTDMMYVDERRAKFHKVGHYGFFRAKHIGRTVADIEEALGN